MLQALESHDALSISDGPRPSKYDVAFFSALRTMLRECLFTKNPGLKRQHIDRFVYVCECMHVYGDFVLCVDWCVVYVSMLGCMYVCVFVCMFVCI